MTYILSNLNYNPMVYVLIILLILIAIAIFFLVYTEHKEMLKVLEKSRENKNENIIKSQKENIVIENTMSNLDLTPIKEENEIIEQEPLIEMSQEKIPDKFDYTQALWQKDDLDLQSLSNELKDKTAIRKKYADKYEEEQEEQAIISYDELIKKESKIPDEIELPKTKTETKENSTHYEYEEEFLNELKELKKFLK